MKGLKGIIALDIDGTITKGASSLEKEIEAHLISLQNEGWQLFFVTGRTFAFAAPLFSHFKKPYFLAVQNGAELFEMPSERSVERHYINAKHLSDWLKIFTNEGIGLLVESGKKFGDITYYCPDDFSDNDKEYIKFRQSLSKDKWMPLKSMLELPLTEFAVGKYFADEDRAQKIAKAIGDTIVIRDPFRKGFYIGHINKKGASKAHILSSFDAPLIAAGDDFNDLEMLQKAKVKIVMPEAPDQVKQIGDIIASEGIVLALENAKKKKFS